MYIFCSGLLFLYGAVSIINTQESNEESGEIAKEYLENVEKGIKDAKAALEAEMVPKLEETPEKLPKTKRKKPKRLRSTTSTLPPITTPYFDYHAYFLQLWLEYVRNFEYFFCMKYFECINHHQYWEREKEKVCGRDYLSRSLVWFDHKCSLWQANCEGYGMFFHKQSMLCERRGVDKYIDYDYLNPPKLIQLPYIKYQISGARL